MTILGWHEHLSREDVPPVWMWHLNVELERHFELVTQRRQSGTGRDSDDMDEGSMIHNEHARGRGREAQVSRG